MRRALPCLALALLWAASPAAAQITRDGFGPFRWGMTEAQARAVAPQPLAPVAPRDGADWPRTRLAQLGTRLLDRPADLWLQFGEDGRLACVVAQIGGVEDHPHVAGHLMERFGDRGGTWGFRRFPGAPDERLYAVSGRWVPGGGLVVTFDAFDRSKHPSELIRPQLRACGIPRRQQL